MKSPTFMKQGLLGLFWWEESNNRALFAKLLWHHKLCTSFNILECLFSENFLLQSRVSHVYVTQRVSSHSDERTSSFTELCTFENCALWCTLWCTLRCVLRGCLNSFAVSIHGCNHNSVNCILLECYVWPPHFLWGQCFCKSLWIPTVIAYMAIIV